MVKKLKRNLLWMIAVAGALYVGFAIYGDYERVASAFAGFSWALAPALLALAFLNYVARYGKWEYYLRTLGVRLNPRDSFSIFLSGLVMSVSPGKMGEVVKSYLVKKVNGTPIRKTAPIIFAERFTDFLALALVSLVGAFAFGWGRQVAVIVMIGFLVAVVVVSTPRLAKPLIGLTLKLPVVGKYGAQIDALYENSRELLRLPHLSTMTLLSVVSWSFECVAYFLALRGFGFEADFFWTTFSYSFAIVLGAVSMLPGGLGVTEGSLTFLAVRNGCDPNVAVAATFLIRAATLWFSVVVGVVAVALYQRRFGKIIIEDQKTEGAVQ
jgi:uncharacterized membrane protein YbhN (UPF0104 family)